jgi:hypothetical protein
MQILTPALANILSDHLSGKPIDRALWQRLDCQARVQLSDAIVAGSKSAWCEIFPVS